MPPRKKLNVGEGTKTVKLFKTLGLERDEEAMRLLRKTASLVAPIMEKRGWVLPLLREFQPEQKNLLGVNINRGQEIRIRLRYPDSNGSFYDEDFILGTMLHELTHNSWVNIRRQSVDIQKVRGPHDAEFYRNLDILSKEFDNNLAKGWTGIGFDGAGIRVGQGISHNVDPERAKQIALKAAEQRAYLNKIMIPLGGSKLGSAGELGSLEKVLRPTEMAAIAAERRMKDRIWCGSVENGEECGQKPGSSKGHLGSSSKASNSSSISATFDDKDDDLHDKEVVLAAPLAKKRKDEGSSSSKAGTGVSLASPNNVILKDPNPKFWTCPSCTWSRNEANSQACEACLLENPLQSSVPEGCISGKSNTHTKSQIYDTEWTCGSCSLVNALTSRVCDLCEHPSPAFLKELQN